MFDLWRLPTTSVNDAGLRQIDGIDARGLRYPYVPPAGAQFEASSQSLWFDLRTGLPLRHEIEIKSPEPIDYGYFLVHLPGWQAGPDAAAPRPDCIAVALPDRVVGPTRKVPVGYYRSQLATRIELPEDLHWDGPYAVLIERKGPRRYLRMAETVLPAREVVVAAIAETHFRLWEEPSDSDLWWTGWADGVRLPYAVNALAVSYYLDASKALRRRDFSGIQSPDAAPGDEPFRLESSEFTYRANATYYDHYDRDGQDFRNVFVAQLGLSWRASPGLGVGMAFTLGRVVVMDADGGVVAVFGDEVAGVIIS
jgi:hypothetical protein